ncbi:MAG TPA: hypothetical protein VLH35_05010 [Candidatus Acidoferrales bacterium]|nr:hypothetical protein [Candidatus Acidoferrales bacterium]
MRRKNAGFVQIIAAIIIAIIIVVVVIAMMPKPIVELDAKVKDDTFKLSQQGTLTLSLKNNDQTNEIHTRIRLITNNLVHLYTGSTEITQEQSNSGNFATEFNLLAGQKIEQPVGIRVYELPQGIANQKFLVTLEVYAENSLVTTQTVYFTVEQ